MSEPTPGDDEVTVTDDQTAALVSTEVPAEITKAVTSGAIVSMDALIEALAPPPAIVKVGALPVIAAIADDEKAALERLPEVYGSVVPTERREITPAETSSLLRERATLKTVEAMLKRRLDDIALTVLNHSDVDYETNGADPSTVLLGPDGEPWITDKGHVVRKVKIKGDDPALPKLFSVETRKGSPQMSESRFQELADDPDWENATHEDYLACTTQTRVWDNNKAMLHLRKKPSLLVTFREAMSTSSPSVSVYERANK